MSDIRKRTRWSALAITLIGGLALTSCASAAPAETEFTFLGLQQNQTPGDTLTVLAEGQCSAENEALPLKVDAIDHGQLDQQLQLLAGQDSLPSGNVSAGTPSLVRDLIAAGHVLDLGAVLDEAGASDAVLPVAKGVIQALYGDDGVYALPNELNIEGIWYNKQLFEDQGIDVPGTWGELTAAAEAFQAAGIQPLSSAGKEGWPVSRLVGNYIFRALGADAMERVADGSAKLTDPEYVAAADAISALGASGAFGPSVASTDYNQAVNQFLNGSAAMFYMGSWVLSNFNDEEVNLIGPDNIGFMPFPAVEGGAGSIDDMPANIGQPLVFDAGASDAAKAWIACIASNYGDAVLDEFGVISGLKLNEEHDVAPLTQEVNDLIANAPSSVIWFEALFGSKATAVSAQNATTLSNGSLSGADYMKLIQDAIDAE